MPLQIFSSKMQPLEETLAVTFLIEVRCRTIVSLCISIQCIDSIYHFFTIILINITKPIMSNFVSHCNFDVI